MTVAFYMNCVSTHQLPLAKEVTALVGRENFGYVYEGESDQAYQRVADVGDVEVKVKGEGEQRIEESDLLLSGLRDLELFDRRAAKGLRTFYTSERWFKPPLGRFRMFVPSYRRMVKRFVSWVNGDPGGRVLAIGPWAKKDFLWMGVREEKIVDWGYFVAPSGSGIVVESGSGTAEDKISKSTVQLHTSTRTLKVLWAGRDLALKRVKDIERAVALANWQLGDGRCGSVAGTRASPLPMLFTKLTGVSPAEVREAMRTHDVFVLASNGYEGWGAVVSEALEEGMNVIGTLECGSCPMLLPEERLYHCGDVRALAKLLVKEYNNELPSCSIGDWTAAQAAEKLVKLVES